MGDWTKQFNSSAEAQAVLDRADRQDQAAILRARTFPKKLFGRHVLKLDTAQTEQQAIQLGENVTAVIVEDATDSTVIVKFRPNSTDPSNEYKTLTLNDSLEFDRALYDGFLYWDAQVGKTMTLVVCYGVRFRSGKNVSVNAGGVSINTGSSVSDPVKVTITGGAGQILLPQNLNRKKATFQVKGAASIYVGGPGVTNNAGAKPGVEYTPGTGDAWANTGAMYACTDGGNVDVTYIEET